MGGALGLEQLSQLLYCGGRATSRHEVALGQLPGVEVSPSPENSQPGWDRAMSGGVTQAKKLETT